MIGYMRRIDRIIFPALLCVVICFFHYRFFIDRAYVELTIHVDRPATFKLFWKKSNSGYIDNNSVTIIVKPGQRNYQFFAMDLDEVSVLRIDPIDYLGHCSLSRLVIHQKGYLPIKLESQVDFLRFIPINQVTIQHHLKKRFVFTSSGQNPSFELEPDIQQANFNWPELFFQQLFLCLVTILIFFSVSALIKRNRFVPLLLASVLILSLAMAVISQRNSHPGELSVIGQADYYSDKWLPGLQNHDVDGDRKPGDNTLINSTSRYIGGLIFGKAKTVLSIFPLPDFVLYRLVSLFCLFIILLYSFKEVQTRLIGLPLIITPMIWYQFSFVNVESICLLLTFFCCRQVIFPASLFNRYVSGESSANSFITPVLLAILPALLFVLDINYSFFIVFCLFTIVTHLVLKQRPQARKGQLGRLGLVTILFVVLVGIQYGIVLSAKGSFEQAGIDKTTRTVAKAQLLAKKSSHGDNLIEEQQSEEGSLLKNAHNTFRRSFGHYGIQSITAPDPYYSIVGFFFCCFVVIYMGSVFFRTDPARIIQGVGFFILSGALIYLAILFPEEKRVSGLGATLLPVFMMMPLLLVYEREELRPRAAIPLIVLLFLFSTYSFVRVGLYQIAKGSIY